MMRVFTGDAPHPVGILGLEPRLPGPKPGALTLTRYSDMLGTALAIELYLRYHVLWFPVFIRSPSPTSSTPELNWVSLASRASRLPSPSCLIVGRSFFKRREPIALPLLPLPRQDRFSSEPWELNPVSPASEAGRLPSSSTLI